jgi:hypothetical protein
MATYNLEVLVTYSNPSSVVLVSADTSIVVIVLKLGIALATGTHNAKARKVAKVFLNIIKITS